MYSLVAILGFIFENIAAAPAIIEILNDYSDYIIGRLGIPYRVKKVNIISIAVDAPDDIINAIAGKISRLDGVSAKTVSSGVCEKE